MFKPIYTQRIITSNVIVNKIKLGQISSMYLSSIDFFRRLKPENSIGNPANMPRNKEHDESINNVSTVTAGI